ncbi:MAG: tyrosine-type recombinase/integrase [Phycisphaerales bacterium]
MTTTLIHRSNSSFLLPPAIECMGEDAAKAFIDFFAAQIRNPNTRAAYFRNVRRFLTWVEASGLRLQDIEPYHVATFIEQIGGRFAAPTVKQHLAALRMLGAFLVVRQVIAKNPAADVRGPAHVVTVGKTPVLTGADARGLFESIDIGTPAGLRDRALLGVMVYTFARVSAVTGLDVPDYYQAGRRMIIRLTEKGGRHHEMPAHHTAIEYLDAYLAVLGMGEGPLFRTINRRRNGYTARRIDRREVLAMVKRRCRAAGLGDRFSNHTFRATGITAYLKNGGLLEHAQAMAAHASPTTTKLYDRRAQEASLDEVERIIL